MVPDTEYSAEGMFQFTHPGRGATASYKKCNSFDLVSIHAPREGCDDAEVAPSKRRSLFQFTHPGRGATNVGLVSLRRDLGFNSRTPGGVRLFKSSPSSPGKEFQFTHPGRGATKKTKRAKVVVTVSIHAPREGCDATAVRMPARKLVSIHAPREGCDEVYLPARSILPVSIHAPREGCDEEQTLYSSSRFMFQFTHPGRGATWNRWHSYSGLGFQFTHPGRGATVPSVVLSVKSQSFNSRTPGGVRLYPRAFLPDQLVVSIHAPREGCDTASERALDASKVSIHAPREGCDFVRAFLLRLDEGFNSRTPGGVRLISVRRSTTQLRFQFTHPGRGATRR